jgi:glycosyltransferase involved in cell wall biosynthesis
VNSVGGRVLVDATAVPVNRAGVGRYVDELLRASTVPLVIACQARDAAHYRSLAPGAEVLPQAGIESIVRRMWWEQFGLARIARASGVSVIHSPHYTLPLFTRLTRVVTFHDATFFSDPSAHTLAKRVFFRTWIRLAKRLADAVIVPSEATARELTARVGSPRSNEYKVIHLGVDLAVFKPPTAAAIGRVRALIGADDRPWLAFLGTVEPRKNLPELLKAYASLASRRVIDDHDFPILAIAGAAGWGPEIASQSATVPEPGGVARVGYLDLDDLHAYLGGALIVVYPSLGEGFGLPVLEAMACGAPVLTTRRLAIPEVGGDAVHYCGVSAADIERGLAELITNKDLRLSLSHRALERARLFSWTRCANEHAQVYADAGQR